MNAENIDRANELYEKILQTANYFLTSANKFSISVLQEFDPSFEELAEIMSIVGRVVYDLIDEFDPHMASKAEDYCICMKKMAIAIRSGNDISLQEAISELERKPFR